MNNKLLLSVFKVSGIGLLQFFIFSVVAMWLYHGGSNSFPLETHYNFTHNFFSDLGRTVDFKGISNQPVAHIFLVSLSLSGFSVVVFFIAKLFIYKQKKSIIAFVGSTAGIIAGLCCIGIAFTPYNIFLQWHLIFVKLGFSIFLIAALCYAYVIFKNEKQNSFYAYVYLVFGCVLSVYLTVLFLGPDVRSSESSLVLHVVSQKAMAYSLFVCMLIQFQGTIKYLSKQERK